MTQANWVVSSKHVSSPEPFLFLLCKIMVCNALYKDGMGLRKCNSCCLFLFLSFSRGKEYQAVPPKNYYGDHLNSVTPTYNQLLYCTATE